jgi:hypothetical protein
VFFRVVFFQEEFCDSDNLGSFRFNGDSIPKVLEYKTDLSYYCVDLQLITLLLLYFASAKIMWWFFEIPHGLLPSPCGPSVDIGGVSSISSFLTDYFHTVNITQCNCKDEILKREILEDEDSQNQKRMNLIGVSILNRFGNDRSVRSHNN